MSKLESGLSSYTSTASLNNTQTSNIDSNRDRLNSSLFLGNSSQSPVNDFLEQSYADKQVIIADFNADKNKDFFWHNIETGENVIWLMDGTNNIGIISLPKVDINWKAQVGDFNGDGNSDLFWRHSTTGENAIWLIDGTKTSAEVFLNRVDDINWNAELGDFNGDSKSDLFWRNYATGENAIWLVNDTKTTAEVFLSKVSGINWKAELGDFNGDSKSDLFWRNYGTGENAVWLVDGAKTTSEVFLNRVADINWKVEIADFNGDSKSDLFWRNYATGENAIWLVDGTQTTAEVLLKKLTDKNWKPQIGDVNGNGKGDLFWRNYTTGQNLVWIVDGTNVINEETIAKFSDINWRIELGEFNGDKKNDLFWWNASTGEIIIQLTDLLSDNTSPEITINDISRTEGDSDSSNAIFTVTLSSVSRQTIYVDYTTADSTAKRDSDYTFTKGTLTFAPGVIKQTISVPIIGDIFSENDETFFINLSNAINGIITDNQGVGTIQNNDAEPNITINDVSFTESDSSTTNTTFLVSLSAISGKVITVDYATADDTANFNSDYIPTIGTLVFAPGVTTREITVPIVGDTLNENNETFIVNLSNANNAIITDNKSVGTIQNNDAVPNININDISLTEGDSGITNATFTISLSAASGKAVTVDYATSDDTVKLDSDYTPITGTLTFAPGVTTQAITVPIIGDIINEHDETFVINLSNANNAVITDNQGVGIIQNNDAVPNITINDISLIEGNSGTTNATFTISLSTVSGKAITVDYATTDMTATSGSDYITTTGTLTFVSGVATQTITVPIIGDTLHELNETFFVNLSNANNAIIIDNQAAGTINNNDAAPVFDFNAASYVVTEGNATGFSTFATVQVNRSGNTTATDTVQIQLANGAAPNATGGSTASTGIDYNNATITINFNPGDNSTNALIPIAGDTVFEPDENISLTLLNPSVGNIGTTTPTSVVTINNDDLAPVVTEIRGRKWNDLNGNGVQDNGEGGLQNWTVFLDQNQNNTLDPGELSTVTDASGNYTFSGLSAGTYTVALVRQRSWRQTSPGTLTPGSGTAGNILVSINNTIREYTQSGTAVVAAITTPKTVDNNARDIIVDNRGNGLIHAYNGTFEPVLSTYDPSTASWKNRNSSGWSTVNNVSYGGITSYQNYIYVTDMATAQQQQKGIVRFDIDNNTTQSFANNFEFIDLTLGLDGLLYALQGDASSEGRTVNVYDPLTINLLWKTTLANDVRGIAVNQNSNIFAVTWSGFIYQFGSDGRLLKSMNSGFSTLFDIDISFDGKLIVGNWNGNVILTNESLNSASSFSITNDEIFVSFSTPQRPNTISSPTRAVILANGQVVNDINFGSISV
jgi:Calx-beta domain/SdrD B-like domain